MAVQDAVSSYHHSANQEIDESTFMAMEVPQGPGSALKFLTDEPSTCFTPNFLSAESQAADPCHRFYGESLSTVKTCDFDWSEESSRTAAAPDCGPSQTHNPMQTFVDSGAHDS